MSELLPAEIEDRYDIERIFQDSLDGILRAQIYDLETGQYAFLRARNPRIRDEAGAEIDWEAKALGLLDHPRVPSLLEADAEADLPYLITEFIPVHGENQQVNLELLNRLRSGLASRLCQSVLEVAEHIHGRGVVHRDLSGKNVLKTMEGEAFVVDFERASYISQDAADRVFGRQNRPHKLKFERMGFISGTAEYMSPEQMSDRHVDARSDVYAVGVMLFTMLFARYPIEKDENPNNTFARKRDQAIDFWKPAGRDVPEELIEIISIATRAEPDERFQTAAEMSGALATFLADYDEERG